MKMTNTDTDTQEKFQKIVIDYITDHVTPNLVSLVSHFK